jgi:hypothetical protein
MNSIFPSQKSFKKNGAPFEVREQLEVVPRLPISSNAADPGPNEDLLNKFRVDRKIKKDTAIDSSTSKDK